MNEEILKKLEQKVNRRSFLRGSSLAAAAIVGVAAASPLVAFAQEPQQQQQPQQDDKDKDKTKDAQKKRKDPSDDDTSSDDSSNSSGDETKIDAQGREYRTCPQCGFNMYRQGRTWTCENCGYSYVE